MIVACYIGGTGVFGVLLTVDADALGHELKSEGTSEGSDGSLGGRIVEHTGGSCLQIGPYPSVSGQPRSTWPFATRRSPSPLPHTFIRGHTGSVDDVGSTLHMRERFFRQSNHSDDVGLHRVLDVLHINVGNILALNLLRGVVDKDVCYNAMA